MIKINKIKAFTLSEMMVAIVIMLLIIGMAFSTLGLVQRHMNGITYNLNKSTRLNLLEQSLWIDFNRYELVEYKNSELKFKHEIDSVVYKVTGEIITKDIDTFDIQLNEIETFFDGKKVNSGYIDAIKLIVNKDSENKKIFIHKNNDATQYMN